MMNWKHYTTAVTDNHEENQEQRERERGAERWVGVARVVRFRCVLLSVAGKRQLCLHPPFPTAEEQHEVIYYSLLLINTRDVRSVESHMRTALSDFLLTVKLTPICCNYSSLLSHDAAAQWCCQARFIQWVRCSLLCLKKTGFLA